MLKDQEIKLVKMEKLPKFQDQPNIKKSALTIKKMNPTISKKK